MEVLSVTGLTKRYPAFTLEDVSFHVERGEIMGLIGRNGAGKSTTLKCLNGLVHPTAGTIAYFGQEIKPGDIAHMQRIAFMGGGVDYYVRKKLRTITAVTRQFYPSWDDAAYRRYMDMFALDENKTPAQLSSGMKVKYSLALAMSRHAELLMLDEPTSGLDPISRDDLMDVFLQLQREGVAILFSTHITADLEKCADRITYIHEGRVKNSEPLADFTGRYRYITQEEDPTDALRARLIGMKPAKRGYTALILAADAAACGVPSREATLDDVIVHLEKEHDEA